MAKKERKSHVEIERKYLLKRLPVDFLKEKKYIILEIVQYYFFIDNKWQRFRISRNKSTGVVKYIHTIKDTIAYGTNDEDEKNISEKLFKKMFAEHKDNYRVIRKQRYVVKFKGLKFEIDHFKDLSLTMLEIELPNIDFPIAFPNNVQKEMLMEVTGFKQFSNLNLAFVHIKSEKKVGGKNGKSKKR
jgi:CYTH domain-containing protein